MRAITSLFTFSLIFSLGFLTANLMNDLKLTDDKSFVTSKGKVKDSQIHIKKKALPKDDSVKRVTSSKKSFNHLDKKNISLIDIMRSEVDLKDFDLYNAYIDYTNKHIHNEFEFEESRSIIKGTDVFKTSYFEGGKVESKTDEKGKKHWDKIKYDNGFEVVKYYDHFQRLDKSISMFDDKRVSYTDYSPKSGEVKSRWVHLQNGDLLFSRYKDGISTEFWKLPDGGDDKEDWIRAL